MRDKLQIIVDDPIEISSLPSVRVGEKLRVLDTVFVCVGHRDGQPVFERERVLERPKLPEIAPVPTHGRNRHERRAQAARARRQR